MDIFKSGIKRYTIAMILAVVCCLLMVVFPETALYSARKGISLWVTDVLPALLPFFICANFLQNMGVIRFLKSGVFPFAMSVLSGYPMGAKIVGDLRRQGEISADEAKRLMSFCNTSGPAFIMGAVGAGMLGSGACGSVIAAAHYTGAVLNGFLYSRIFRKDSTDMTLKHEVRQCSLQESFTDAILMSLKSLGIILAYIVMFMFITDSFQMSGVFSVFESREIQGLMKGIIEMTVGCGAVAGCSGADLTAKCVLCSFIISWGGFSVMGQTMSMLSGCDVSIGYLMISKLTHGLFSAAAAFLLAIIML